MAIVKATIDLNIPPDEYANIPFRIFECLLSHMFVPL